MVDVARLRGHSDAFDKMLSLIPPQYYFPRDSVEAQALGVPPLRPATLKKRSADQMSTQQRKEASKKGKRAKLVSGGEKSILDVQYGKFQAQADTEKGEEEKEDKLVKKSVSVAQLRCKLQGELAELSSKRKAKLADLEERRAESRAKRKDEPREDIRKKRKDTKAMREEAKQAKEAEQSSEGEQEEQSDHEDEQDDDDDEDDEQQFQLQSNTLVQPKKHLTGQLTAKGASKYKLLRDAEAKEKFYESIEDPEERKLALENKSWDEALLRAQGQKVQNSTKILKKSIKREEKKKKRSSAKWQDRAKTVVEMQAERQEKRKFNIAAHQQKKKDWKAGLKVSKKPGFEGKYSSMPKKGEKMKQRKDVSQKSKFKKAKI